MLIRLPDRSTAERLLLLLTAAGTFPALAKAVLEEMDFDSDPACDPDRQKLIDTARDIYSEEGDREIAFDSDAMISEVDAHAFVMAWCYVTYRDAGLSHLDTRPGREDSHLPACAVRVIGSAPCTCGKADREIEEEDAEAVDTK